MDKLKLFFLGSAAALLPMTAYAYVGPGAGLSLLGALWALILALLTAIVFIFAWPIKRMLRKRHQGQETGQTGGETAEDANVTPLPIRKQADSGKRKRIRQN